MCHTALEGKKFPFNFTHPKIIDLFYDTRGIQKYKQIWILDTTSYYVTAQSWVHHIPSIFPKYVHRKVGIHRLYEWAHERHLWDRTPRQFCTVYFCHALTIIRASGVTTSKRRPVFCTVKVSSPTRRIFSLFAGFLVHRRWNNVHGTLSKRPTSLGKYDKVLLAGGRCAHAISQCTQHPQKYWIYCVRHVYKYSYRMELETNTGDARLAWVTFHPRNHTCIHPSLSSPIFSYPAGTKQLYNHPPVYFFLLLFIPHPGVPASVYAALQPRMRKIIQFQLPLFLR